MFFCLGCSSSKNPSFSDCNENSEFKKIFFAHLATIHKYQKGDGNKLDEENSLRFVSQYAPVSFESRLNYDGSYPGGVYEKDRAGWIQWYENNKCNDLQIKKLGAD